MSKSSQRARSMYQLGREEGLRYKKHNPNYTNRCKDYMRGWNSVGKRKKVHPYNSAPVIILSIVITILVLQVFHV